MNRQPFLKGIIVTAGALGIVCSLTTLLSKNHLPIEASPALCAMLVASVLLAIRRYDHEHVHQPIDRIRNQLRGAVSRIVKMEAIAETQRKLDDNLHRLRELVYRHGDPGLIDGALYFGATQIGADNLVVDRVQAEFGGAATIFCGDTRVSTNVRDSEGRRAIGSRLGEGAAHTALYKAGTSYRGEVVLLVSLTLRSTNRSYRGHPWSALSLSPSRPRTLFIPKAEAKTIG